MNKDTYLKYLPPLGKCSSFLGKGLDGKHSEWQVAMYILTDSVGVGWEALGAAQ